MWRVALTRRPSATLPPSSRNRRTQNESWDSRRRKSLFFNRLENGRTQGSHTLTHPPEAMLKPDHGRKAAGRAGGFSGAQPLLAAAPAAPVRRLERTPDPVPRPQSHRGQGLRGPARPRDPRRSSAPVSGSSRYAVESCCDDHQRRSATRNAVASRTNSEPCRRRCRRRALRFT